MRLRLLVAVAAVGLSVIGGAAAQKKQQRIPGETIGNSVIILGDLDIPVGATVTIHGKKTDRKDAVSQYTFFVDSINGKQLDPPKRVSVQGIYDWSPARKPHSKDTRKGY